MSAEPVSPATAGDRLNELLAKALRPVAVEIRIDPVTLDRLFTLHFEEAPPAYIAVGLCELTSLLQDLAQASAKSLN